MHIIAFSEIKWSYLTTRKQQLLRRFPADWKILFLEPYKAGLENHFRPWRAMPNITVVTMPFLKNLSPGSLQRLISYSVVRDVYYWLTAAWVRMAIAITGFSRAEVSFVSNLYAVPYLSTGKKIVYDMNDHHLAFENTPVWLAENLSKLCVLADRVVVSCRVLSEVCPADHAKIRYIGNGVDTVLFDIGDEIPESRPPETTKEILYVGAISEIVDFGLLKILLSRMSEGHRLKMVGPIFPSVAHKMKEILENNPHVASWIPAQPQRELGGFIRRSSVCLIPFLKTDLTRYANPNKAYEYLSLGKTVVATNASAALDEMREYIHVADNPEEFISLALADYSDERAEVRKMRCDFARKNDWMLKAREYTELLRELCNE